VEALSKNISRSARIEGFFGCFLRVIDQVAPDDEEPSSQLDRRPALFDDNECGCFSEATDAPVK
jgi:hypothetical protein